jgi:hypothetical protein
MYICIYIYVFIDGFVGILCAGRRSAEMLEIKALQEDPRICMYMYIYNA